MILAIDTSTLVASVAIVDEQGRAVAERWDDSGDHCQHLLTIIEEVLRVAGTALDALDALAIGCGPGSFTGLRIGMATAKGLALAAEKPLWAVSSLAAVIHDVERPPSCDRIAVVADARRREVFVGLFDASGVALAQERLMAPTELGTWLTEMGATPERTCIAGDAIDRYREALVGLGTRDRRPRTPAALGVARCALAGDRVDGLVSAAPVYIRPSEAEIRFPDGNPGGTFAPPSTTPRK